MGILSFWAILSILICVGLSRYFSAGNALLIWIALHILIFISFIIYDGGSVTGWVIIFVQAPCFFIGMLGLLVGALFRNKAFRKNESLD